MAPFEQSPGVETYDLIAGIGNHEAKALLLLHLGKSATMLSRHYMGEGFKEFLGSGADWYPSPGVPFDYCINSLEPIGQVLKGTVQSHIGEAKAYAITEFGQEVGIPTAGLILDWSLNHPDISVQRIFGPTHSKGAVRAPQNRASLLAELVTSPESSLSTVQIAGINPADWESSEYQNSLRTVDITSRALAANGIVSVVRRETEGNNRLFRINGIDQPDRPGPERGPITLAIQDFVRHQYDAGKFEFTAEEVVAHTTRALPDEDPAHIRTRINNILGSSIRATKSTSHYRYFPSVERLEIPFGHQHTQVTLNDSYKAAVEALVEIVIAVDDRSSSALEKGRKMAEEISADTSKKQLLIAKAYNFSAVARRRPVSETMDAVIGILRQHDGPADARTVYDTYTRTHSRPITEVTIKSILRRLTKENITTMTKQRSKASNRKLRNYYQLAEN
ncbi:MAG TPA: hypothetical protein VHB72_01720 [Candidatus Saccharimonadales bacterium]|nr:hypothetical protein [Candidatus Saccharimonadales bacterium]